MRDERLYRASLRVASSILSGIASALLVGLPLSGGNLSYLAILTTMINIGQILTSIQFAAAIAIIGNSRDRRGASP